MVSLEISRLLCSLDAVGHLTPGRCSYLGKEAKPFLSDNTLYKTAGFRNVIKKIERKEMGEVCVCACIPLLRQA